MVLNFILSTKKMPLQLLRRNITRVYFKFRSTAGRMRDLDAWQCLKTSKWLAEEYVKYQVKCKENKKCEKSHVVSSIDSLAKLF